MSPDLTGANSTEFDPATPDPVIYLMKEWFDFRTSKIADPRRELEHGRHPAAGRLSLRAKEGTLALRAYGQSEISERHRHRYEFNNAYRQPLEKPG